MIVKRAAGNQGIARRCRLCSPLPVHPIGDRFVLVKQGCLFPLADRFAFGRQPAFGLIQLDDPEASVHACEEDVSFALGRWVPFGSPHTASDGNCFQGHPSVTCVEDAEVRVIAGK